MQIQWLKYMRTWLVSYHGKQLAVGQDLGQAIGDALYLATLKVR